jgi:hypothetical protein
MNEHSQILVKKVNPPCVELAKFLATLATPVSVSSISGTLNILYMPPITSLVLTSLLHLAYQDPISFGLGGEGINMVEEGMVESAR